MNIILLELIGITYPDSEHVATCTTDTGECFSHDKHHWVYALLCSCIICLCVKVKNIILLELIGISFLSNIKLITSNEFNGECFSHEFNGECFSHNKYYWVYALLCS